MLVTDEIQLLLVVSKIEIVFYREHCQYLQLLVAIIIDQYILKLSVQAPQRDKPMEDLRRLQDPRRKESDMMFQGHHRGERPVGVAYLNFKTCIS